MKIFLFLISIFLFQTNVGYSFVRKVEKSSALQSIQKAIKISMPNDTVLVYSGIFKEHNIVIDKPIKLIGVGSPVIDGENKYEIISVFSSDVVIEGFEIRNGGISSLNDLAGIKIYKSQRVIVKDNLLKGMFFGIYFQECSNCIVIGNVINSIGKNEVQSGNGIHCWKSSEMKIFNNKISGQRDGIYFEFVTNSTIENNLSENNIRYGLHFMFSHHNNYINNIFQHNGAGVAVMYTHHVLMLNNTFNDNWGGASYGLLMKDISDSNVKNNHFVGNTSGIYLEGCSRNDIKENVFLRNGCAIRIQASCDNNVVERNNFISNTFDVNTNGSLVQNIFKANYWDKYEGYDLNRDKTGDVPYHPISLYSMIIERMPVASIFLRSLMVGLLDKTEKAIPSITPSNFQDDEPKLIPYIL